MGGALALVLAVLGSGCGEKSVYVGSDVLWTARFESGTFAEWTDSGGSADARSPNTIQVSTQLAHEGGFSAKLAVSTPTAGAQQSASFALSGVLPDEAYYSAWYYLPSRVSVGVFWILMKFRVRRVATDASTDDELYDLNLKTLPSGDMSLRLYSHRPGGDVPLDVPDPIVPVGRWFQIEAFYRNVPDATARITFWLDEQRIVDVAGRPTGAVSSSWVGWNVCSIAENLNPAAADLYVDDVAVSRTRVGPTGILAP